MMLILAIMRMMMLILAIMMARAISYRRMHFTAFLRFPLEAPTNLREPTNLHQKLSWRWAVWGGLGTYKMICGIPGANKFAPKMLWH